MARAEHDISSVLQATWQDVADEVSHTPLSFWNESVFRFFFVRTLLRLRPDIRCGVEWRRIDLLIQDSNTTSLVEFKFYCRRRRLRNLHGQIMPPKGRASQKNFDEFCDCVRKLATIEDATWRVRDNSTIDHCYLVLAYSGEPFGQWYDSIKLPSAIKQLTRLTPVLALDGLHCQEASTELKCKLLEVRRLAK